MPPPTYQSPLDSHYIEIDETPGSTAANPIIITNEETCGRCGQHGHTYDDCDTRIRSFTTDQCVACQWKNFEGIWVKPTTTCNHYDISPAEVKRIQRRIDENRDRELRVQREQKTITTHS
jgi:hypothetical protein